MGSEYFIDRDSGVLCDRRAAVSFGVAVGFLRGRTRKKCTLTPFFGVYKWSKRICIRNINIADSCGVLA